MAPLVVIVGETASGKSALAMELAQKYNGEIICADSRTIFKGMDIGTAKPTEAERAAIKHHLVDMVDPGQEFTVVDFKRAADAAIADIAARGKLPIMVGGTGLYVDAVVFDYQFSATKADQEKRAALEQRSVEQLRDQLQQKNIFFSESEKNKRHLIRLLEREGGSSQTDRATLRDNTLMVGLAIPRAVLRERIYARVQQMMDEGILDEVRTIGEKFGWESEAMTANIYRIFAEVVQGRKRVKEAMNEAAQADIYLAKRQRTWFKRNPHIVWLPSALEAQQVVEEWLAREL